MPRFTTSLHWSRMAAGAAMLVGGAAIIIARPGTALAHHAEIDVTGDCAGWTTKAEYVGGNEDRKVVVDVTVNGESIQQTFFFDNAAGHLGHQDYWLLYERTGTGSLQTSGTVTVYLRSGGVYSVVDNTASIDEGFECEEPDASPTPQTQGTVTPLPTDTPEPTATDTPEPTATETSVPTATNTPEPTPTEDITIDGTITPLPSDTPVPPSPTATDTPANERTHTPIPTNTPPPAAPTFISTVRAAVPPNQPPADGPPSSRQTPPEVPEGGDSGFPRAGYGTHATANGLAAGIAGLMLAAGGLVVMGAGMRRGMRRRA